MKTKNIIKSLSVLFAILMTLPLNAQVILEKANKHFNLYEYTEAIPKYEKLLKRKPDHFEAISKLADSYRHTAQYDKAEYYYNRAVQNSQASKDQYLYLAQSLMYNAKYKQARVVLDMYLTKVPDSKLANELLEALKNQQTFFEDQNAFQVHNLNINSANADFGIVPFKDGIVFCSSRIIEGKNKKEHEWTGKPFLSLYQATGSKHLFSTVLSFASDLKTKYNEGPVCFNSDFTRMYLTRNNIEDGKVRKSNDFAVKLKLFGAKYVNGVWVEENSFPYNSNEYSTMHAALNASGDTLYFASDRPGGMGGTDLYFCIWQNGKWDQAQNLGPAINTPGNELFPFYTNDYVLFFSSNGHQGIGGLDIYKSERQESNWTAAQNMGAPINSSNDDFGFITEVNGKSGYFSSNRSNGKGDDDIYYFRTACHNLDVLVYDKETNLPLVNSEVIITSNGLEIERHFTDDVGRFSTCLETDSDYELLASKQDYLPAPIHTISTKNLTPGEEVSEKIPLVNPSYVLNGFVYNESTKKPLNGALVTLNNRSNGTSQQSTLGEDGKFRFDLDRESDYEVVATFKNCAKNTDFKSTKGLTGSATLYSELGMYCQNDIVRLDNIYYDLNKYNIRADAAKVLDSLVLILNKYPEMRIELRSHTDCRSSDQYNLTLSQNRAKSAVEYIVRKGIDPKRMEYKGYGETLLLNHCDDGVSCSEEEHQLNRRTEFKILSVGETAQSDW
ncbi:MAG TPA: OmpA family protein [Bacteroidia bacterium]|nr:OmpA family protein [Bacteroidia bacterium]HNT80871.1 OmpA family protein [Bacteroidia bacterium]